MQEGLCRLRVRLFEMGNGLPYLTRSMGGLHGKETSFAFAEGTFLLA